MKRVLGSGDFLAGIKAARLSRFGTGHVVEIVGIPVWRLQKFLGNRKFRLSSSGQLGSGYGSRRLFKETDIYRIAIADRLVRDGFTAKVVSSALAAIEDTDLLEWDEKGRMDPPDIAFHRGEDGPRIELCSAKRLPPAGEADSPYYVLDAAGLVKKIDRRIWALENAKRSDEKRNKKS